MTDQPFTSWAFAATGGSAARTMPNRLADMINVKDYGALGNGSNDDTSAIQAAVNAMYAVTNKSCILFFPPGSYKVTNTIDISNPGVGSNYTSGTIHGSGRYASTIYGAVNTGFIFSQTDGINGPEEISNLGLNNSSTVIGTGALFFNNSQGRIVDCSFTGMICVLMPYNIFQASIENCTGTTNSHSTTGHTGTFGIAGYHCNVMGWRTTSAMQAGIQFYGANTAVVSGCGIENCTVALIAGMSTGWASSCTVSGTTLTVGGSLGNNSGWAQFTVGSEIFMQGLTTTADWGVSPVASGRCVITALGTGTGGLGTYTINRSATISSPVPCVSRYLSSLSGTRFEAITTEACYYIGFFYGMSACSVTSCGGSATVTECVDALQSTTGFTSKIGFYIFGNMGAVTFDACAPSNVFSISAWYFEPVATGSPAHITFNGCIGRKDINNITGTSSSITNGSGSAGTVLNVVSLTQGVGVGIGMRVTGSGVTAGTVVTGNHATDGSLTGTGGLGTYRVNNSQNITGTAITIVTGDDWIMPDGAAQKTALQFINCTTPNMPAGYTTGLNTLNRTFTSLPGQAGANTNFPVYYGMEYDITDSTTATWGSTAAGGGANKVKVRYNGTNWTVTGA